MCKIYIIQHCQSEHHINELTGGWTDTPLTELGINQSKAVAEEIENLGLSDFVLYSSDLKRAFMTAEYISERFGIKITDTELLREINNGEAANKTKEWASKNKLFDSNALQVDKPLWNGAETPRELYQRMESFIECFLINRSKDIVIVSHGVVIGYLISSWLKISPEKMSEVFLKGNAGGISCISNSQFGQNILTMFNLTIN